MNAPKNLISTIHSHIQEHALITPGATVILGLSGGPDSLFLLHALAPLHSNKQITLIAAHLDHEWRPDSHKDVEFCQNAAQKLGVALVTAKMSELAVSLKFNGSKEELGRKARRYFFEQVADTYNAQHIALAHHADDQHETFFIRLLRGSSLTGLTGIKWKQGRYIRPLLGLHKQEILAYLHEHNIPYLTDPTNTSSDFLRNRIREQVVPALKAVDSRFDANMKTTLARLQETEQFLESLVHQTYTTLRVEKNNEVSLVTNFCEIHSGRTDIINFHEPLKLAFLLTLHPVLQQRLLMYWFCKAHIPFQPSQGLLQEVLRFLQQPGNKEHQVYLGWGIKKIDGVACIIKQ